MKIGILSLNPGQNYGGILQSYALKTILERMGHQVKVISLPLPPSFSWSKIPQYMVRSAKKIFKKDICVFRTYNEKKHGKLAFCQEKLNLKYIRSFQDIKAEDFNAIIVGSDQVWRPRYFEEQYHTGIENAFLDFSEKWDIKRVAYAPSFGVDEWEYNLQQTEQCAKLIALFDAVSVREESGKALCKKYLHFDGAVLACDPTLLLTKSDYEDLITNKSQAPKGNLLVYCLDHSEVLDNIVKRVTAEKNLRQFRINNKTVSMPSIGSWLRAFRDSEFIITDSFHACVFSIIFQKPFIVIGNVSRGMSRFDSLLKTVNQKHRMLYNLNDYDEKDNYFEPPVCNEELSKLQSISLNFLKKALQ